MTISSARFPCLDHVPIGHARLVGACLAAVTRIAADEGGKVQVSVSETAPLERLTQWLESYFAGFVSPNYIEDGVRHIAALLAPEWQFVTLKKRPAVAERWHVLVRFQPEDAYVTLAFCGPCMPTTWCSSRTRFTSSSSGAAMPDWTGGPKAYIRTA